MSRLVGSLFLILLLGAAVLGLGGCEKERPAPTVAPTPMRTAGAPAPQVVRPTATAAAPGAASTPAPPTVLPLVNVTSGPITVSSDKSFIYKVVQGDTLATIARTFNTTAEAVRTLNKLQNADVLSPGQELKIPGDAPEGYGGLSTYVVRAGDTLASIADRYGTSTAELQRINNLSDPNQVMVGQTIKVPATAGTAASTKPPAATAAPAVYVVKAGDTLAIIAARFGTTAAELQRLNDLANPNSIRVGQSLKLPSGAAAATAAPRTHVVKSGETLSSIAIQYGVTMSALQAANNISNASQINVGQVSKIP